MVKIIGIQKYFRGISRAPDIGGRWFESTQGHKNGPIVKGLWRQIFILEFLVRIQVGLQNNFRGYSLYYITDKPLRWIMLISIESWLHRMLNIWDCMGWDRATDWIRNMHQFAIMKSQRISRRCYDWNCLSSGCSTVRLVCLLWEQEVLSSNLSIPTVNQL